MKNVYVIIEHYQGQESDGYYCYEEEMAIGYIFSTLDKAEKGITTLLSGEQNKIMLTNARNGVLKELNDPEAQYYEAMRFTIQTIELDIEPDPFRDHDIAC